jgi:hypothetical protein
MLLAAAFGVTAVLRRNKPLHPIGAVAHATWQVTHPAGLGAPLLESMAQRDVLVRLSRAASLAHTGWDVMGLAVRVPGGAADGCDADLLFATTGAGRWTRYVLVPRRTWGVGDYTTLLPLAWRGGTGPRRRHPPVSPLRRGCVRSGSPPTLRPGGWLARADTSPCPIAARSCSGALDDIEPTS